MNKGILALLGLNIILFTYFFITKSFLYWAMGIHIVSILALLATTPILQIVKNHQKDIFIAILLAFLSIFPRLYQIEEIPPGMYGDEVSVAIESVNISKRDDLTPFLGYYSHPTPLLHLTNLSLNLFGRSPTSVRLPEVLFGSLSVGVFYLFLSLFLNRKFSVLGAVIFSLFYPNLVLSRLAYEPAPAIFFEILCFIFLYKIWQKPQLHSVILLAFSIAGGLYTYLNFRLLATAIIIVSLYLLRKYKGLIFSFISSLFIFIAALAAYSFVDPSGFWLRAGQISIFSRNYSPTEFIKELLGNIYRVFGVFYLIGDPNPGKNPAGVAIFDFVSLFWFYGGLLILFLKKRWVFLVCLVFIVFSLLSDILATEVIPEFHYYGLGHPNTLRISGVIPIVLTIAMIGLKNLDFKIAVCFAILIIYLNAWPYFNQQNENPRWYAYNKQVNQDIKKIDFFTYSP